MNRPWRDEWQLNLDSGAHLRVREWGNPEGPLIVFHHGTPSSSVAVPGGWDAAARNDALICSFDRPGYGGSPRQAGRMVSSAAGWSAAVADALGRSEFAVIGTSGGGPHAAAAAAALPERVTALGLIVSLGPLHIPHATIPDMMAETEDEIAASRAGELALRHLIDDLGGADDALDQWMALLPASDQEVLARTEVQHEESVEHAEWSANGVDGWVDDDLALFATDWGFDPSHIGTPTFVLYGESDVLVPPSHARLWQSVVPGARCEGIPHGGHWLRDHEPRVLDWVESLTPRR
ncbi:alpha/beta hydrolase [Microbacterium sp. CCNWLW134]|uniref:alpha/beta hydrolase n=1 Tax=Microbacterium sp. CCNWLW134 TaxID=3122064 RepID=UPI0030101C6A